MNDLAPGARAGQLIFFLHTVEERLEAALEPLALSVAKFGVLAKLVAAGESLPLLTLAQRTARRRSNTTPPTHPPDAAQPLRPVARPGHRPPLHPQLPNES